VVAHGGFDNRLRRLIQVAHPGVVALTANAPTDDVKRSTSVLLALGPGWAAESPDVVGLSESREVIPYPVREDVLSGHWLVGPAEHA
jgi:hypothetical protein